MGIPKCESGCEDPWERRKPRGPPSGKAAGGSPSKWGGAVSSQMFIKKKNQYILLQEGLDPKEQLSLLPRATP